MIGLNFVFLNYSLSFQLSYRESLRDCRIGERQSLVVNQSWEQQDVWSELPNLFGIDRSLFLGAQGNKREIRGELAVICTCYEVGVLFCYKVEAENKQKHAFDWKR